MKRGAERQIQREDGEDPHEVDANQSGFSAPAQATGAVSSNSISDRPIRGLPKKKLAGGPQGQPSSASPSASSFSGFSGFGSSISAPPASKPLFSFSSPSTNGATSTNNPASGSLNATAKPFTFGAQEPSSASTILSVPSALTANSLANNDTSTQDVDHYLSLRGLNVSLQAQLSAVIEKELQRDPFVDLSEVLRNAQLRYSEHLAEVQRNSKKNRKDSASPAVSESSQKEQKQIASQKGSSSQTQMAAQKEVATPSVLGDSKSPTSSTISAPKPPESGKFSFAGVTASGSGTANKNETKLMAGQPTFELPKQGFFTTFGKDVEDDNEGSNTSETGSNEQEHSEQEEDHAEATPVASFSFKPTGSTDSKGTDTKQQSELNNGVSNAIKDSVSSTEKPTFSFGAQPSTHAEKPASSAFSFGTQTSTSSSNEAPSSGTTPFGAQSSSSTASSFSNAPTFSFGSSASSSPSKTDKSAFSFSTPTKNDSENSHKFPSIGSNFANASGVSQPGAFNFGASKISFGSNSPSSPSSNGFGSASSPAFGSTTFSFGARPKADTPKDQDTGSSTK